MESSQETLFDIGEPQIQTVQPETYPHPLDRKSFRLPEDDRESESQANLGGLGEVIPEIVAKGVKTEKTRRLHKTGSVMGETGTPSGQDISVQLANQDPTATQRFEHTKTGEDAKRQAIATARKARFDARIQAAEEIGGTPAELLAATKTIVIDSRKEATK